MREDSSPMASGRHRERDGKGKETHMPDESTIRTRLDAYAEAWRTDDREAFLGLWADDAHWEDPVGSAPMRGRDAIAEFWDKTHAAPMTLRPEPERVIVCGDEAMLIFRMCVRGAEHFEFDDGGRIVRARAFWDDACRTPVLPE
jgi:steroid delta-isomerase